MSARTIGAFTVGVPELARRGGFNETRDGGTIEDEWVVILDDGARPSAADFSSSGFPQIGDAAGTNEPLSNMFVTAIKWAQDGPRSSVWRATVTYSPGTKTASSSTVQATYCNKRWSSRSVTADLVQDANDGRAVVNSAGEPFDSVPQREVFSPVVSFTMLSTVAPATLAPYNGTVNAASVTVLGMTFAAHCARLSIECRKLDRGESSSNRKYEYTVTIEGASTPYSATAPKDGTAPQSQSVSDIGWDVSALDCGYCQLDGSALVPILLDDADGNPQRPQAPLPLSSGVYTDTDPDLHYLRFAAYKAATWPDYLQPGV